MAGVPRMWCPSWNWVIGGIRLRVADGVFSGEGWVCVEFVTIGGGMEGVGWVGLVRARWVDGEENLRICKDGRRVHDGKIKRHPSRLAARETRTASDGCDGGLECAWQLPQQVQSVCVWWRWR